MPSSWIGALQNYSYRVNLAEFIDASNFPGWFTESLKKGDREETISFENNFCDQAENNIEPWLEVVYWKLYSQPRDRNKATKRIATHFAKNNILPQKLWDTCHEYIYKPTRKNFEEFRVNFGFKSRVIAVAATFPAFINPSLHPMVDTRIAKWVGECADLHNHSDKIRLSRPPFLTNSATVLTLSDFDFMGDWIQWCRHMSIELSAQTEFQWRARDVEMAVFTAWGNKGEPHPKIHLNPIF